MPLRQSKMKILEEKENHLLNRKEVKLIVEAPKNPSMAEALKILADKFKAEEEMIAVKEVQGKFGRNTFLITGNIYKDLKDKQELEKKKEKKK